MARNRWFVGDDESGVEFRPSQWRESDSPFCPSYHWEWANVAYLLSQIVGEFLVKENRLIATRPTDPMDVSCLQWLVSAIRCVRLSEPHNTEGQGANSTTRQAYHDPQLKMWVLAGACYALLLASLPGSSDCNGGPPPAFSRNGIGVDSYASRELKKLHAWWEVKISMWMESQTLPGEALAMEVLDKVASLTSVEGEMIIEQLHRDSVAQVGG